MSKELINEFRDAAWRDKAGVERFIAYANGVPTDVTIGLLAVLQDRRMQQNARQHQLRCRVFMRLFAQEPFNRELFVPFVRALRNADPVLGESLVQIVPRVNSVGGHRELVPLFKSTNPQVRGWGKTIAEQVGGKTLLGVLAQLCELPDFPGRLEAVEAMVAMAGYHAVPALKKAILAAMPAERIRILEIFSVPEFVGKHRDIAVEAITGQFASKDPDVVRYAILALGRLADPNLFIEHAAPLIAFASFQVREAAVEAMGSFADPRIISMLEEQLEIGPNAIRLKVLTALQSIGTAAVLPVVIEALNHKHIQVRLRAAEVLRSFADTGRVDVARTIIWLLRSHDLQIKRIAADVARSVKDDTARLWPRMLGFLRDEDWWVRERITDALIEMAGTQLTRHVVAYLQDESDVIRRYGVEMLMRLKDPAALGALVRSAQSDTDWWVRERAIEAVGEIGDPRGVPYVLDLLRREADLRLICLMALRKLADASAGNDVGALTTDDNPFIALEALATIEAIDAREQARAIALAADHADHRVRMAAQQLMEKWQLDSELRQFGNAAGVQLSALDRLLVAMAEANGDDLILSPERAPYIKAMGKTTPLTTTPISAEQVERLILPQLTEEQQAAVMEGRDVDISHEVKTEGLRFRVNIFRSHYGLSGVFRIVKNVIPRMEDLNLPGIMNRFGDYKNGLVLIGGPTGSGKSTTLAAIIDYINRNYAKHIITLEDPIEVVHTPKRSAVTQREIGTHSHNFDRALRSTLREDPDVILVGEMRDFKTISFAVSAAETGHLVFGTVHTASADTVVDRLINAFPHGQQSQVRSILASSLRAVACQYLAPRIDTPGRMPIVEIMVNNEAVANLIRKGKTYQLPNLISMSREQGMRQMDQELIRYYKEGVISPDIAYMRAVNKKDVEAAIAEHEGDDERIARQLSGSMTAAERPVPRG